MIAMTTRSSINVNAFCLFMIASQPRLLLAGIHTVSIRFGYEPGRFAIHSGQAGGTSDMLYSRCHLRSQRPLSCILATEPSIMQTYMV